MYNDFFGFRENPFPATPNPHIFFSNSVYQRAYANLLYGICERTGVIVLTGEAGTGKTTLLRRLMNNLEHTVHFAFCPYTTLSFPEIVDFICSDFGLSQKPTDCAQQIKALQQFLTEQQLRGQYAALLIDEAHNLHAEVLARLAALASLTVGNERLLPIVLAGQEELRRHLGHSEAALLREQVTISCQLDRLKESETSPFIYHRLRAVGYEQQDLFPSTTVQRISTYAHGIPRAINIICDNALLIASIQATKVVTAEIIDEVARDLQLTAIRLVHIEESISQSVAPPPQYQQPLAQQSVSGRTIPSFLALNLRQRSSRIFFQKKSQIVLWGEIGAVAVLLFLLFFHSSPTLTAKHSPISDPPPSTPVIEAVAASPASTLSSPADQPLIQKQGQQQSVPGVPQPEIPQITVATLLKSPAPPESTGSKTNRGTGRDPFTAALPTDAAKEAKHRSPSRLEASVSPITTTNPQTQTPTSSTNAKGSGKDGTQLTPLMVAAMRGQTSKVRTLLKNDAQVNTQTATGRTALMFAALSGRNAILQDLIKRGANVNMQNAEGWTALMYAAWNGHTRTVQTLIKNGAQIDTKNDIGNTALSHAVRNGHHRIARFLRNGQVQSSGGRRPDKSTSSLKQSTVPLPAVGKRSAKLKGKHLR